MLWQLSWFWCFPSPPLLLHSLSLLWEFFISRMSIWFFFKVSISLVSTRFVHWFLFLGSSSCLSVFLVLELVFSGLQSWIPPFRSPNFHVLTHLFPGDFFILFRSCLMTLVICGMWWIPSLPLYAWVTRGFASCAALALPISVVLVLPFSCPVFIYLVGGLI